MTEFGAECCAVVLYLTGLTSTQIAAVAGACWAGDAADILWRGGAACSIVCLGVPKHDSLMSGSHFLVQSGLAMRLEHLALLEFWPIVVHIYNAICSARGRHLGHGNRL